MLKAQVRIDMHKLNKLALTLAILLAMFVAFCAHDKALAKEMEEEREYKPIDLVLVIDGSGSMSSSDPGRTAISAGRMLTNMMPAADSRIAIISFNTKATVHTGDGSDSGALVSLDTFANVETVREALSEVKYSGDTGIGNALFAATELLRQQSDDTRQGAIILFTDGTNDFGRDAIGLARCEENESLALKQAKKLGYPVYCVGYDYKLSNGGSSMGANGEGLAKLQNIADTTGGRLQAISDINEMEQLLIDFLADVCDLNYKKITTIPGDGELHEAEIPVSPSVVELDVRIAGGGEDAISKGEVHLYDPNGNEIKLTNSGNIRYDVDASAASIKVVLPQPGDWKLTVNGIYGDEIHVGMLEHFKMNLKSRLVFPDQNPEGVVYAHDKVGIEAWLTYEGEDLTDEDLYKAVTSATATFVSRADENDVTAVELKRKGTTFTGSFTVPADSFYDITIRINWDTVYRESKLTVMSSNKPLELVSDIGDVTLNKNKSIDIENIYQYVRDEENDLITAEVGSIGDSNVVDVTIDSDKIVVTGRKWSSTLVTIIFRDKQGNTVESTFKAKVNDPVALALIIGSIVALVLAVLAVVYLIYRRTFRIYGHIRVGIIKERTYDDEGDISDEKVIFEDHNRMNKDVDFGGVKHTSDTGSPWGEVPRSNAPVSTGGWGDLPEDGTAAVVDWGGAFDETNTTVGGWGDLIGDDRASTGGWGDVPEDRAASGWADTSNAGGASTSGWGGWGDDDSGEGQTFGTPQVEDEMRPTPEQIEDERRDTTFDGGRLDISLSVTKKDPNLLTVLETFNDAYARHMTMGNRTSPRAVLVGNYIATRLRDFSQFKIEGTRFGRGGIRIRIPKQTAITVENPRPVKGRLVLKKTMVMAFAIRAAGAPIGIYVEIEYEPLS